MKATDVTLQKCLVTQHSYRSKLNRAIRFKTLPNRWSIAQDVYQHFMFLSMWYMYFKLITRDLQIGLWKKMDILKMAYSLNIYYTIYIGTNK